MSEDYNYNTFVLSWDMFGLEAVINLTEIDKEQVWAQLKSTNNNLMMGRPNEVGQLVNKLILRAKFNTQRHYEIYSINVDVAITVEDIRTLFKENPQSAAELIRQRGNKIHSDRFDHSQAKIL
jgi:hypothetical protein